MYVQGIDGAIVTDSIFVYAKNETVTPERHREIILKTKVMQEMAAVREVVLLMEVL